MTWDKIEARYFYVYQSGKARNKFQIRYVCCSACEAEFHGRTYGELRMTRDGCAEHWDLEGALLRSDVTEAVVSARVTPRWQSKSSVEEREKAYFAIRECNRVIKQRIAKGEIPKFKRKVKLPRPPNSPDGYHHYVHSGQLK